MPFGWGGSPSHFAALGDARTIIHGERGLSDFDWNGAEPFSSRLYLGAGIFIELLRRRRMGNWAQSWGRVAKGLLEAAATNQEKLGEEGLWRQDHAILGFVINSSAMSIALPGANRAGSQVLVGGILRWGDTHVFLVKSLQQLRGRVEQFRATSPIWAALAAHVGDQMTHGDENSEWANFPNFEVWGAFWQST